MKKKKIIILVGAPGSGKGTQAELLAKKMNMEILSPGAIFRKEVEKGSVIGKKAGPFMKKGLLVRDDIVCSVIINRIKKIDKSIILDGFPRNQVQAKVLGDFLKNQNTTSLVIEIALPLKTALKRISGRLSCNSCGESFHVDFKPPTQNKTCDKCGNKLVVRSDSKEKIVKTRWQIYQYATKPIVAYYKTNKHYSYQKVDGTKLIPEVFVEIFDIVKNS